MTKYTWATCIFGLLLLLIILSANNGMEWIKWFNVIPLSDKLGHFGLFGFLAFLVNRAMQCQTTTWFGKQILLGSLWVLCFVIIEEFSQIWFDTRTFDLTDLMYDGVGIYLGGFLAIFSQNWPKLPRIIEL